MNRKQDTSARDKVKDVYDISGLSRAEAKAVTHMQNYDGLHLLALKQENQ